MQNHFEYMCPLEFFLNNGGSCECSESESTYVWNNKPIVKATDSYISVDFGQEIAKSHCINK